MKKVRGILENTLLIALFLVLLVGAKQFIEYKYPPVNVGSAKDPELVEQFGRSVFRVLNKEHTGGGTGFSIVTPSGLPAIITNAHVCAMGDDLQIDLDDSFPELPGLRYVDVKVLAVAAFTDLCLLSSPDFVSPLKLSKTNPPKYSKITIIGYPLLLELTPSSGVVLKSSFIPIMWNLPLEQCKGSGYRVITEIGFFGSYQLCIRDLFGFDVNAPTFPGNSGSPVLSARGEVVGVLFAGNNATHWGSVIPISMLNSFLEGQ